MFESDTIVIFDTEYTSWEGCITHGWDEDRGQYKELVQIGALRVDTDSLLVDSEFEVIVQPKRNPQLSSYFIELTGITQLQVERQGVPFETAVGEFIEWLNEGDVCYSYGKDIEILKYNCDLYGARDIKSQLQKHNFRDVRLPFEAEGVPVDEFSSGTVTEYFNRDPNVAGSTHNALYDCYSIVEAIRGISNRY